MQTTALKILAQAGRGSKRHFAAAAIAIVLATMCAQAAPLVLRFTIDSVIGEQPAVWPGFVTNWIPGTASLLWLRSHLWACGLGVLLCAVGQGLFDYLRICAASVGSENLAQAFRERLFDHINHLPFQAQMTLDTGDLIQRCSSDVETVRLFFESQILEVARIMVMLSIAVPVLLFLDTRLALYSVCLLPLVMGGSAFYFFRVKRLFQISVLAEAALTSYLQETLTGVRTVKAFGREPFEIEHFGTHNRELRDRDLKLFQAISIYWGGSALICMLQIGLVLVIGALAVTHGRISIGTFTVFVTYVIMLVWPIRMLGHVLSDAGRTMVSLHRIRDVLAREIETPPPHASKPEIRGGVEFRGVGFEYASRRPVLHDISFTAQIGQTIAILGRTGSGKSTLVHLLPRLLDYATGSIRIDGCELRNIDPQWLRRHIGIVLQEPFLFSRSVRDNIRLGAEEEPEHLVLEAAHIADIHDTIEESFQAGYDTFVGERGVTLSGGQRQRIAIARALLRNPPILIFDDSLSAVDAETDQRIRQELEERRGQATTFIISHRISTLSRADLILVIEDGRLTQQGSHCELAAQPGLYQRICDIQNQLEDDLTAQLA